MSVHLIGGGRDEKLTAALFAAFIAEARDAAPAPLVRMLLVLEADDTESVDRFRGVLAAAGAPDADIRFVVEGEAFELDVLDDVAALAVGGGLTPAYLEAVAPLTSRLRERVEAGMPYLGFSAGAAIAATDAVVGGWLLDGVPIGDEHAGEELDDLAVRPGIGLVRFSVDVHAAQWGTVTRLVAAVDSGAVREGYAIDEHTALVVTPDAPEPSVRGVGAAWHVGAGQTTSIRRLHARG